MINCCKHLASKTMLQSSPTLTTNNTTPTITPLSRKAIMIDETVLQKALNTTTILFLFKGTIKVSIGIRTVISLQNCTSMPSRPYSQRGITHSWNQIGLQQTYRSLKNPMRQTLKCTKMEAVLIFMRAWRGFVKA